MVRRTGAGGARRRIAWLAVAAGVALLVALDLGLRVVGALPPDDPLLFFTASHAGAIDPFVTGPDGFEIRPDWVNDGLGLRGRRGVRAGRQFLRPGFRPARVTQPKPKGTVRIVALGGSTTYGLYVGSEAAFPAVLGRRLAERLDGRPVEVVNLGCPGFASDRVAGLLPAVIRLDPDLVVILTGHNEMLGGELAALSPALALRATLLRYSSLFAWWNHALAGALRSAEAEAVAEEVAADRAGEIPTFVPEEAPLAQRASRAAGFRSASAARYAENLSRIAGELAAADIPALFVLPVANLHAPPLTSEPDDADAARELREALRAAAALREAGHDERAEARLREATLRFPEAARAHYALGLVLLALGRTDDARAALQRAVDEDVRTHRIDSLHEAAWLSALRGADPAPIDLRPVLQAELEVTAAGRVFVDHVHPTAEGHARIADALLPAALPLLER